MSEPAKLPIYELRFNPNKNDGLDCIALVDRPAIGSNFVAFNSHVAFQTVNAERRILMGPAMIPDKPIYRKQDPIGEHYVTMSRETIEQIVLNFFALGKEQQVNMMHEVPLAEGAVTLFESFIVDSARGISTPQGFANSPDGTWFISYKVNDEALWEDYIKTGIFQGFSIQGFLSYEPTAVDEVQMLLKEIDKFLG